MENKCYFCNRYGYPIWQGLSKGLVLLWENGRQKYRFQPEIVRRYVKVVNTMKNAGDINDLMRIGGLHYKRLAGNKKGLSSVRVNDKYRIEFVEKSEGENKIATICNITELTNHYQ